ITTTDTTNPTQLQHLLNTIPPQHPLTTIIHTAATLNDHTITTLTPHQLHTTLNPKTHPTRHPHQHTKPTPHPPHPPTLSSSPAATLGSPAQANYAAANAYQDALAHHATHHGQPTTSIAWGLWNTTTGTTTNANHQRFTQNGIQPLHIPTALRLFDVAL